MANRVLLIGFDTCDKNLFLVINNQGRKYKIAVFFKVINATDFNIHFICLLKCYIEYIIDT